MTTERSNNHERGLAMMSSILSLDRSGNTGRHDCVVDGEVPGETAIVVARGAGPNKNCKHRPITISVLNGDRHFEEYARLLRVSIYASKPNKASRTPCPDLVG